MRIVLISFNNHPFGMQLLKRCSEENIEITAVIFEGEEERKKDLEILKERSPSIIPIRIQDLETNAEINTVKKLNSEESLNFLKDLKPDLLLQGGGPIIKKEVLEIPTIGMINCHPGILPNYRGCSAVEWALFNDEPVGCTCHFMDHGIDTGPIILSKIFPIQRGDTYSDIRTRMFFFQVETLIEGIKAIQNGVRLETAQVQGEGTYRELVDQKTIDMITEKLKQESYKCYAR
ncbi:MAG: formyltransferase family protein [Bdellovibrionota bacterium]